MGSKTGILLNEKDIKLHRQWFLQMVKLIGINVGYLYPLSDKHYNEYDELKATYSEVQTIGCIFDEHPTQKTLKKLGWISELQTDSSLISVAYDTPNLQQGCLFLLPSGIDGAENRAFRVISMQTSMIYPASITCEIIPEYSDKFNDSSRNYKHQSISLVAEEDDPGL